MKNRRIHLIALVIVIVFGGMLFKSMIVPLETRHIKKYKDNIFRWIGNISDYNEDPIAVIRKDCGQLCDTTRQGVPGPFFNYVTSEINCSALFRNEYIDCGSGLVKAPKFIPKHLWSDFTMQNRIPVEIVYYNDIMFGKKAKMPVWTKRKVQEFISMAVEGKLKGYYGASETNALRDGLRHAPRVKNGRVLVIGSQTPWVEACVLEAGAREVVTLEYSHIISKHPAIKTLVPAEFRQLFLNKSLGYFDAVVTFSSIEHSGFGRYGDALNPWGDILAIARAWCVTKNGGSFTIGVPFDLEHEYIKFNEGRVYGKIRYPYLASFWQQVYQGKGKQRVHVFKK